MGLNQVRGGEETKEMRTEGPGHTRLWFCEVLPVPSEELTEVRGFKWEKWQQRYVYLFQRRGPLWAHLRREV